MNTAFLGSFLRDVKKLREARVRRDVAEAIRDVEDAPSLAQIPSLKRLSGHAAFYRIRIGDYRIGLKLEGDTITFVRCLHRREVYRFFP